MRKPRPSIRKPNHKQSLPVAIASSAHPSCSYRSGRVNPPLVLVIGAGPTGMTAAIELKRAGLDVRVIDKSDHLALHSQALVIQARTLEQLQRYGIAAETISRGRKLTDAKMYSDGKQIVHFNLEQLPSRYPFALFLPQSETERILNHHMESL